MSNFNTLSKRKVLLEEECFTLQNFLAKAPEGSLISRMSAPGKYSYYQYLRKPGEKKKELYISQSNNQLAQELAYKAYAERRLSDCKKELHAIAGFMHVSEEEKEADRYLITHPGVGALVLPLLESPDAYAQQWMAKNYVRSNQPLDINWVDTIIEYFLL